MTRAGSWAQGSALVVLGAALVIAIFAFLLRFNALGGALGGLDDEDFHNTLSRVDLVLAGEQPLRDFADPDLRGAWPALTYEVPALMQRLFGNSLLPYAAFTCGALALCAVLAFAVGHGVSRSLVLAVLAAVVVIVSAPKLYNYAKVLSLAGAVTMVWWVVQRPSSVVRLAGLAAWTVVAALYRHDYAVYVGAAAVAALAAVEPRPVSQLARRVGLYAGITLLLSLPSIIWVAQYAGVSQYVSDSFQAVEAEGRRLRAWPIFDLAEPMSEDNLASFNYYLFWAVPYLVLAAAAVQGIRGRLHPRQLAMGLALGVMAFAANLFFLRSNLPARFGDAVVPVAVGAAWLGGVATEGRVPRMVAGSVAAVLLVALGLAFIPMNSVHREMATGGLSESPEVALRKFRGVVESLRGEPPSSWEGHPAERKLAAARYLAECTAPGDRVLMAALADEVAYFGRRHLAGGQRRFNGVLTREEDQQLVIERMARQSVPVVIMEPDYEEVTTPDYPVLVAHLKARYREAGVVADGDTPLLRVWVERNREPVRTDAALGFPCFR